MDNVFIRLPESDLKNAKQIILINKHHGSEYQFTFKGETQDILSVDEILDLLDDLKVSYEELEMEKNELVNQIQDMYCERWEQEDD